MTTRSISVRAQAAGPGRVPAPAPLSGGIVHKRGPGPEPQAAGALGLGRPPPGGGPVESGGDRGRGGHVHLVYWRGGGGEVMYVVVKSAAQGGLESARGLTFCHLCKSPRSGAASFSHVWKAHLPCHTAWRRPGNKLRSQVCRSVLATVSSCERDLSVCS